MKEQLNQQLNSDLQMLVKIVKKTYLTLENITLESSLVNTNSMLHKISEENKYLLEIIRKYRDIEPKEHEQVLQKMTIKLKQWFQVQKYRLHSNSGSKDIRSYSQQIELSLKIFEKSNNFIQFVTKVYSTANEQLRVFKIKVDICSQSDDINLLGSTSKLKRVYSQGCKPLSFNSKQIKSFNFSQIYSMQIDNSYIKSNIVVSQRNPFEWLHSQLSRNKHIQQDLESYHKQHFLFNQKKRNKNSTHLCPKINNKQNLRIKTTVHEKLYHNFQQEKSKRFEIKQKENTHNETAKDTYKLNNLYVAGNQFDVYGQNNKSKCSKPSHQKKKSSFLLSRVFRDSLTTKNCNINARELMKFLK